MREALFNTLAEEVQGAEVWDLFAGTGATGIEALSRGAGRVLFLEKSNQALRVLRQNVQMFDADVRAQCHVLKLDAWDPPVLQPTGEANQAAAVAETEASAEASAAEGTSDAPPEAASEGMATPAIADPSLEVPPDLIFLDPPYKAVAEDPSKAVWRVSRLVKRLAEDGVLCFHFQDGVVDQDDFDSDLDVEVRRWGTSAVALVRG